MRELVTSYPVHACAAVHGATVGCLSTRGRDLKAYDASDMPGKGRNLQADLSYGDMHTPKARPALLRRTSKLTKGRVPKDYTQGG